jgi:hypothetical protein
MLGSGKLDYGMAVEGLWAGGVRQSRTVHSWARRSGHGEARRSMSGRSS